MTNYTIAQLKTELTTDPKGLGYSASYNSGDAQTTANIINHHYSGVGTVWKKSVPASDILGSLVWSEVSAWSQTQWEAINAMLAPLKVDASNTNVRTFFAGILSTATASLANISVAAQVVSASRAQELWGDGTSVPWQDVSSAINS